MAVTRFLTTDPMAAKVGGGAGSPIVEPASWGLGYSNLKRSNTSNWRAAVGSVRAKVANAKLALIGDSTTRGLGAAGGNSGDVAKSYPSQLATQLATALGLPTGIGNMIGGSAGGATPITGLDSRVSFGGVWTSSAGTTAGGTLLTATSGGTLTFKPGGEFDTADIYYPKNSGWGTWNADMGAAATLITNSNANGFAKTTLTGGNAVQTISCAYASSPAFLAGIDTYNSAIKQISCWNMGWSGATANSWKNSTFLYSPLSAMSLYAPNLSVICLGINDMTAGTTAATFKTNMQLLITACLATGDVILVVPVPVDIPSNATQANQDSISQAIIDLAATNDLPVIDFRALWQTYTNGNTLGYYFGANHPNGVGYGLMAAMVSPILALNGTV